jgi:ABC-type amino acid transport system permease subunit
MPRAAKIPVYFGLPLIVTLIFILYQIPAIASWWMEHIPDPMYRCVVQALLLFTIAYVANRWIYQHRIKHGV